MNWIVKAFGGNSHEKYIKSKQPTVDKINEYYQEFHELSDDELQNKTIEFKEKIQDRVGYIQNHIEALEAKLCSTDFINIRGTNGELDEKKSKGFYRIFGHSIDQASKDLAIEMGKPKINEHDDQFQNLSIDEIYNLLDKLEKQEKLVTEDVLNEILPEAFAAVKERCRRLVGEKWDVCGIETEWDMEPFNIQLVGGIALHEGNIAEMATGEGKTLVATMPLYLNALIGKGAHLVTVNDYLAQRDCEWMGKIYEGLGLSADFITNEMKSYEPVGLKRRQKAYNADITYGTNNEFGFDYLRDNMVRKIKDLVQRRHNYAIIDEVDSVLIDEARTPLIISGPQQRSSGPKYIQWNPKVKEMVKQQNIIINKIIKSAKTLLLKSDEPDSYYKAGFRLLQARCGAPKNKKLKKILETPGIKTLMQRVEYDLIRDKKQYKLDWLLYYSLDLKNYSFGITDKGHKLLSNNQSLFVLPDLDEEFSKIDNDEEMPNQCKKSRKQRLQIEYAEKSEIHAVIRQLVRSYSLFERDEEYVVTDDGRIMIVDEFTGRLMPGRKYSKGLHQAIEAKHDLKLTRETQPMGTISLQNYFRLYNKLAGMTGTAETEADEFWKIYGMEVVVIPTNETVRRIDYNDQIYKNIKDKYAAVIEEIKRVRKINPLQPILVGTIKVKHSEYLSKLLKKEGIEHHSVLNARRYQEEAEIIKKAGQPGMTTIATNMAGRGADIQLGKDTVKCKKCYLVDPDGRPIPEDLDLEACKNDVPCGLYVIGTDKHEARRIDRQLRGRSGRQSDPGASRFYISFQDGIFNWLPDRYTKMIDKKIKDGEYVTGTLFDTQVTKAQKAIESRNSSIREHILEYDSVMNEQREIIYKLRLSALKGENMKGRIIDMIDDVIDRKVEYFVDPHNYEKDDWCEALCENLHKTMGLKFTDEVIKKMKALPQDDLCEKLGNAVIKFYNIKEKYVGSKKTRDIERFHMLNAIDYLWKEQLYEMDELKQGVGLHGYGGQDPLVKYKQEGYKMFEEMMEKINNATIHALFRPPVRAVRIPREIYELLKQRRQGPIGPARQLSQYAGEYK